MIKNQDCLTGVRKNSPKAKQAQSIHVYMGGTLAESEYLVHSGPT